MEAGATPRLRAAVESAIPNRVYVGRGAVLFVHGWCYHEERRIARLSLRVGDQRHDVPAHSMPRADLLRERDPARDPGGHAFRSGFWALVPLPAIEQPARAELELVASLRGGGEASHPLGEIDLDPGQGLAHRGGAAERRRHGSSPWSRSAWRPTIRFHPPSPAARLDPRPDAPQLDLPDQRRPLGSRRLRDARGRDRGRRAVSPQPVGAPPRLLPQLRARARPRPGRSRPSSPCPTRTTTGTRTSSRRCSTRRAARASPSPTATCADRSSRATLISSTYWTERRNNHTNLAIAARRQHDHRRRVAVPARPARAGAAVPAADRRRLPRSLARPRRARQRADRVRRPAALRLRPARRATPTASAVRAWAPRRLPRPSTNRTALSQWLLRLRGRLLRRRLPAQAPRRAPRPPLRRRARRAQGARRRPLPALAGRSRLGRRRCSGNRCARSGPRARRAPSMGRERLVARGLVWRRLIGPMAAAQATQAGSTMRRAARYRRRRRSTAASRSSHPRWWPSSPRSSRRFRSRSIRAASRRVNMLIPTVDLDHFFAAYIGKFNLARRLAEAGAAHAPGRGRSDLPAERLAAAGLGLRGTRLDPRPGRGRLRPDPRAAAAPGQPRATASSPPPRGRRTSRTTPVPSSAATGSSS